MRARAMRNFRLGGKDYKAGQPFTIDDVLGDKLRRTRYLVSLEADAAGEEVPGPISPLEAPMGMLRRETRTTAPIPNPPAGPEALHPALLPHGTEELTEEHLDEVLGGTLAEEVRVMEVVANTDPDSSDVPAEERNAAAEDLAAKQRAEDAEREAMPPAERAAAEEAETAERDPKAELEAQQAQERERESARRQATAKKPPAGK
jgi:hypothetical protein